MSIALPWIEVFGEPTTRLLFARTWALRERALLEVEGMLYKMDPNDAFCHGLHVVNHTIPDKIVGVVHASISLLLALNTRIQTHLNSG